MNRISRFVISSVLALFSRHLFGHPLKLARLHAGWILLLVLVSGAWKNASAQVSFTGAQRTLGSGFSNPAGVKVDGSGNVFVADSANNKVKEIVAAGGYTTVNTVGSGFTNPHNVAVDRSGNVFVADYGNGKVKEIVAVGGVVSSSSTVNIVGSGFSGPTGVAVDGSGNVFVSDYGHNAVKEIVAVGGVVTSSSTVIPVGSGFSEPMDVAVDGGGNVFVADYGHIAVKEIVAVGGIVSGSSTVNTVGSGFSDPTGVAVDASGNVFVADQGHSVVKEIVAVGGVVSSSSTVNTVGIGFSSPMDVAVDGSGNLFVADTGHSAITEIMAGAVNFGSVAVSATSITVNLYFTISSGTTVGNISVMTTGITGLDYADAGSSTCTATTYSSITNCVVNVKFTPAYPGTRLGAVEFFDGSGNSLATVYVTGTGTGPMTVFYPGIQSTVGSGLSYPDGVAVDAGGNVYISDSGNNQVLKVPPSDPACATPGDCTTVGSGLSGPTSAAVDGAGNVYIADTFNNQVLKVPLSDTTCATPGDCTTVGSGLNRPGGVAVDGVGNVYIADTDNNRVLKEALSGGSYTQSTIASGLSYPNGVTVDGSGNVYIADTSNDRILKVPPGDPTCATPGDCTTIGSGLSYPGGVAVDGGGNVYIADGFNYRALMETLSGGSYTQTVIANTANSGLKYTCGVATDGSGNVYIDDLSHNRILKMAVSVPPSLSFATTGDGSTSIDSPQTVTLWNLGNEALTFPIPGTGNNPSISTNFTLNSSESTACPLIAHTAGSAGTLALGTSCTLPISFVPAVGGSISGSLIVTDNTLNGSNVPQTISLSGTGVVVGPPAQLVFAIAPPDMIDVGGNAGTVTVNIEDASNYVVTTSSASVILTVTGPLSYSQAYTVAASSGVATFNLSGVTLSTPGSYTYTATSGSLTAATAPESVMADYSAPTEQVGTTSSTQTATIPLSSSFTLGSISVLTMGAPNLDFNYVSGGTCIVGTPYTSGQVCTVKYTFKPTAPGTRLGAIVLFDNTTPTAVVESTAYLTGTGNGPMTVFYPGTQSSLVGNLLGAVGIAVDGSGNVYIVDGGNNRVLKVPPGDPTCATPGDCTTVGSGLNSPGAVAVDGAGNVYIADTYHSQVLMETLSGGVYTQSTIASGLNHPWGVAVDGSGNVYIADTQNNRVLKVPPNDLTCATSSDCTTVGSGIALPYGVAVDGVGNVYIANYGYNQVLKVPPGDPTCATLGDCTTVGSGLYEPSGVAVDGVGNVYIDDTQNNRVLMETLSGGSYTQSVIMNSGLEYPTGVAVDRLGNIYIADGANSLLLKLDVSDPTAQIFATTPIGVTSSDSPRTVTLWNLGNETLTFPILSGGNNPSISSSFTLNSSGSTACPLVASTGPAGTLALGTSCTLPISFTPPAAGGFYGSLILTDNNLNGNHVAQAIPLSGGGGNITTLTLDANPTGANVGQAVTLTATLGAPGNNIVTNGGFETGDFTGWTSDGYETVDTYSPHTGSYDADFWFYNTYGTISQTLTTTKGASYTLSFWLENDAYSGSGCDFKVLWNSTVIADISGCNFLPYSQFSYTVTGTGSDTLSFSGENPVDDTYLDDVSVIPVAPNGDLTRVNGLLVSFYNNGSTTALGTGPLLNGVAAMQTSALPEGNNNVTASFPGGVIFAPSTSAPVTVKVAGPATQVVILSGNNQTAAVNTDFAIPLVAEVEDANGIPVPGLTITFQVTPATNGAGAALYNASSSTGCANGVNVSYENQIKLPTKGLYTAHHPMSNQEAASITPGCAAVIATANGTTGSYIVTATAGSLSVTFNLRNVQPPNFTVTTLNDDATGIAANCHDQSQGGATLDSNCSLRDAIKAARAVSTSTIAPVVNFAPTLSYGAGNSQSLTPSVSTPGTITIDTGGSLTIDRNIIIAGLGANVLSVASANQNVIFYIDTNGTAVIFGLTINGGTNDYGGGIENLGTLTVINCTISNNTATDSGGGIYNDGTLAVVNSTISNNTATNYGGGIYNDGTLTVFDSTFSSNSAAPSGYGGGLYTNYSGAYIPTFSVVFSARLGVGGHAQPLLNRAHPEASMMGMGGYYPSGYTDTGTATVTNSTFNGNSDGNSGGGIYAYTDSGPALALVNNLIRDPVSGPYVDVLGNVLAGVGSATSSNTLVAPLGFYGGPTQTMPLLPGNIGICAGLAGNLPVGVTTDQRGTGFPQGNITYPGYSAGSPCVDAGAVQTNYALSFTRQPPASIRTKVAFTSSNAPQVTLTESGSTATFVSGALSAFGSPGSLSGNSVTLTSGVGSYSGLSVTSGATTEQLTARLGLNASLSTPLSITATSNTFDVIGISLPSTLLPGGTVGVAYSTTITASNGSGSYIYTVTGTLPAGITLNSSTGVLSGTPTAGGTFNITVTATDSTNASASQQYTLTIAPPTITITPATLPAGTYGSTYSQSVSASGGTSSYTYALAAGSSLPPGLSLNTSTGAITGSPAAVSASAYTFTITATDSSTGTGPYRGSQNFSLTINKATQTISFALSSPVTYGVTPITLSATGGGSGNAVTFSLVSGPGSITGSTLTITGAGTVVVTANQAGSANYTAAAQVTKSIVVNQAATAVRLACGSIPIFLQSAFTLSATVSSSAGTPTGSVSFLDGSTPLGSGTVSGGVAAMTITSMAMGSHSITAAYSGDTNFLASTSGTLTQMVEDFSVSVASSGSTQTTRAGGTATYPLVVTPMGGATLPSAVTLNVSGLPTGATATFTPQVVPAGSSTSNVVLTIQLPSVAAKLDRKTPLNGKAPPLLWGILLLPLAGSMQRVRKRLGRKLSVLLLIVVGVAAMAGLSGCSSTSGFFDQLTNSYTIAVTGTSGTLSHSTSVTLTVQ